MPVKLNGQDVGLFSVDTGATATVIDSALASKLGLKSLGTAQGRSFNAQTASDVYFMQSVAVADVELRGTAIVSSDLSPFRKVSHVERSGDFRDGLPSTHALQDQLSG